MDRDIKSNVRSGREHEIKQKRVPLESKASGAGTMKPMARGAQKVQSCTDESYNSPANPLNIKGKELRDGNSDWKALKCPSSMCNCSYCLDERRK